PAPERCSTRSANEAAMASESSLKPTFSFEGTVRKVRSATMTSVPVDERTTVVRIDHILESPENLLAYQGREITVQLSGRGRVTPGQKMIFHTAGWMFGDGLAVRSVGAVPAESQAATLLRRAVDPVQQRATKEAKERFDAAHLVVSGRVVAVKLPAADAVRPTGARRAMATEAETTRRPMSEHDPK